MCALRGFDEELFPGIEGINSEEYIVATYLIEVATSGNALSKAAAIAIEQSTGTWLDVPEETPEVRQKYAGKVLSVFGVPDYEYGFPKDVENRLVIVKIGFPHVNFGNQIPMLLTTVFGNVAAQGRIRLLDVEFPRKYLAQFKGPKYGIDGIRKIINVYDRPLLNNMIKPCTGITPEVGAKLAYEAAVGGCDFIKDDELIGGGVIYSKIEDRVKSFMKALKRADEEKGEKTLYTVNITDRFDRMLENAKRAIDAGANALMVNFLTAGFGAVQALAEDPNINVPILGHEDFLGALMGSPYNGVSSPVIAKLARLSGLDATLAVTPFGKHPWLTEKATRWIQVLRANMGNIKPSLPLLGGGIFTGTVPVHVDAFGNDCIIGVGGAIHGHPMGATAGARAFRKAIDAAIQGQSLEEAAASCEELKIALDMWGTESDIAERFKALLS